MSTLFTSLEEFGTQTEIVEPTTQSPELSQEFDDLKEAKSVNLTLKELEGTLNETSTQGQVDAINLAVEHFKHRLIGSIIPNASMEARGGKKSAADLVNDIKRLRKVLSKNIQVSQESFFGKLRESFARGTTSKATMLENCMRSMQEIQSGYVRSEPFEYGEWAQIFLTFKGQSLNYEMIETAVKKAKDDAEFVVKVATQANNLLREAHEIVSMGPKNTSGYQRTAAEIYKLLSELDKLEAEVNQYYGRESNHFKKVEPMEPTKVETLREDLVATNASYRTASDLLVKTEKLVEEASWGDDDELDISDNEDGSGIDIEINARADRRALNYLADRVFAQFTWVFSNLDNRYDRTLWGVMRYLQESVRK